MRQSTSVDATRWILAQKLRTDRRQEHPQLVDRRPRLPATDLLIRTEEYTVMRMRTMALAAAFVFATVAIGSAQLRTEQDVQEKLEQAGYTHVRDIKFSGEGIHAKATKDGKEVSLVVDSSGKIMEQP
jgi:hypothetical protein